MITIKQAKTVKYGNLLSQEDVDFVNTFNETDEKKLYYIACHAQQYHSDSIVESKRADRFHNDAYGS